MGFTDKISALIFALIVISVVVYVIMSFFVIGPIATLKPLERVILGISAVGIVMVIVYAASELLFRVVF